MKTKAEKNKKGSMSFVAEYTPNDCPLDFETISNLLYNKKEEDAIKLLKELGYVIFKPTFTKL